MDMDMDMHMDMDMEMHMRMHMRMSLHPRLACVGVCPPSAPSWALSLFPGAAAKQGVDLFGATLDGALLNGAVIYAADLRETSWRFASLVEVCAAVVPLA